MFWLLVPVCVLILTKRVRIGWLRGILLWLGFFLCAFGWLGLLIPPSGRCCFSTYTWAWYVCLVMTFFFPYPLLPPPFPLFLYPLNLLLLRTMDINKYATRSPLHYIFPTPSNPLAPFISWIVHGCFVFCGFFFFFCRSFLPLSLTAGGGFMSCE